MKKFLKENYIYIIIIIVVLLIRTFIATPVRVDGKSMNKTLSNGDIMILNKLGTVKRESIVVIDKEYSGSTIIKRIIGMPGETIECKDGVIYINGTKYDDKYAYGETSDFTRVTLKDDEYYVLGDNRLVSADSRYSGPVKEEYIKGTTNIVLFPFNRIGKVK